jgi:hypothetical protein
MASVVRPLLFRQLVPCAARYKPACTRSKTPPRWRSSIRAVLAETLFAGPGAKVCLPTQPGPGSCRSFCSTIPAGSWNFSAIRGTTGRSGDRPLRRLANRFTAGSWYAMFQLDCSRTVYRKNSYNHVRGPIRRLAAETTSSGLAACLVCGFLAFLPIFARLTWAATADRNPAFRSGTLPGGRNPNRGAQNRDHG